MDPSNVGRIPRSLAEILAVAGGIAITLMMAHIVLDVAMKYFLNDPIDGTTEIVAAYYMVTTVFLPLAYVSLTEGHLVVELFTGRMSARRLNVLTAFTGLVTLAYLIFLIYCTTDEAVLRTIDGEAWETSVDLVAVWPSRWLLPLGMGAMAIIVLVQTVGRFRHHARGGPAMPPGV